MIKLIQKLELKKNYSLKKLNTWKVGGVGEYVIQPNSLNELIEFMIDFGKSFSSITFLGLGSNVLIKDNGVKGLVVLTNPGLSNIEIIKTNHTNNNCLVRVEAGVPSAKFARFCNKQSLVGMEFLAGIPGAIGGAVAMNAGAFGGQTFEFLEAIELIDCFGNVRKISKNDIEYGYRHAKLPKEEFVVGAYFNLTKRQLNAEVILNDSNKIKELLRARNKSQPIGMQSCGSVFKNPNSNYAARLIESCNLKGLRIGGACVSTKHANFILNDDNASAKDIEDLLRYVQKTVLDTHGILLEPEVRILGE